MSTVGLYFQNASVRHSLENKDLQFACVTFSCWSVPLGLDILGPDFVARSRKRPNLVLQRKIFIDPYVDGKRHSQDEPGQFEIMGQSWTAT